MPHHNSIPSQSEIDSQFDDIMSAESWSDEFNESTQAELESAVEVDSPLEVVNKQTDRIVNVIDELIPNTNVTDRQRFIAKLDRKHNETLASTFNFDKDIIKQNEATSATFNFNKETIQSDDFAPGTSVSVGRYAYKENPAFIDDGWTVNSVNTDGTYEVTKYGASQGKNGQITKTVTKEALESWQVPPLESEDTTEADDSNELPTYSKKTAKALDWVAEKIDNKHQDREVSGKLYDAANFIDEESKTTVAKAVLKSIGRIGLDSIKTDVNSIRSLSALSADKIRAGIDKMDERSRENDGWLSDKVKKSYNDAKDRRAARRAKNLQDKAFDSYESNLAYTETDTIAQAQAMNEQNDAFASYEENVDYAKNHEDTLVDHEALVAAQEEAKARAEAATAAKQRRALRRQKLKASGKEVLLATQDRVSNGRIGRATVRATRNVKTYHQAGRDGVSNANAARTGNQKEYDLAA